MGYSEFNLYFGDPHAHSNFSRCGICYGKNPFRRDLFIHVDVINDYLKKFGLDPAESLDILYEYAREKGKLDFVAVTDHDFSMSDQAWGIMKKKADEWYSPGCFVTLVAYEWTSYAYGHRNVYFYSEDAPLFRCVDYGEHPGRKRGYTPKDLWDFLRKKGIRAITIPHHPSLTQFPVDWSYYDPEFDRLVEIVSLWGVFEYFNNPFQCVTSDVLPRLFTVDSLEYGYRLGFIGGSDSHDCKPGSNVGCTMVRNAPKDLKLNSLSRYFVPYFVKNPLGTGLAAIYAKKLTREALFEALFNRRVYAVVGERIKLEFKVDGRIMGEELRFKEPGHGHLIEVRVEAPKEIDRIEVVKNGKLIFRKVLEGKTIHNLRFTDDEKPSRRYNYYYARVVLKNGARAWSSPIWVIYEKLGEIEATLSQPVGIILENKGANTLRKIQVAFLREFKCREKMRSNVTGMLDYGAFFWTEKTTVDEVMLTVRFKSPKPLNFRGYIRLYGFERYTVKPINFAITKYGGDLFYDDYHGYIEWDVTPSSHVNFLDTSNVKGLDLRIKINPFIESHALVEILQGGELDLQHTIVNGKTVAKTPFKITLNEGLHDLNTIYKIDELKPGSRLSLKIPPETSYILIHPSRIDDFGTQARLITLKQS
ncbi:MAG: DUF3604 domain-containing protein [Thermoproteales archaeon]|nr:DUF3604 domain-containing protein [Thermoproteales archaeon]